MKLFRAESPLTGTGRFFVKVSGCREGIDGWIALLTNIEGNNEKESKSVVKVSGKLFEIYYGR